MEYHLTTPISPEELKKIKIGDIVYVTGTHLKGTMGGQSAELPGYAMIAAIVQTSTDPWFFKAVGPQVTIDYWRPAFESFAKTIKK